LLVLNYFTDNKNKSKPDYDRTKKCIFVVFVSGQAWADFTQLSALNAKTIETHRNRQYLLRT
jgi:hypothetical protein